MSRAETARNMSIGGGEGSLGRAADNDAASHDAEEGFDDVTRRCIVF